MGYAKIMTIIEVRDGKEIFIHSPATGTNAGLSTPLQPALPADR